MEPDKSSVSPARSGRFLPVVAILFLVPLLATVVAVIGILIIVPWHTVDRQESIINVVLSSMFAHVTLLSAWNALGSGKHVVRPVTSLMCVFAFFFIGITVLNWATRFPNDLWVAGIAMLVQWAIVQVPLWFARLRFGWQFGILDEQSTAGGLGDIQFEIKHLILWMTFVAIVLGLGRSLLQVDVARSRDVISFGLFLICNCLFSWPTVVGLLSNRWMPLCFAAAVTVTLGITMAEPYVFQAALGVNSSRPNIFLWLNGIQFAWLAGTMLVARKLGLRLVRRAGRVEG